MHTQLFLSSLLGPKCPLSGPSPKNYQVNLCHAALQISLENLVLGIAYQLPSKGHICFLRLFRSLGTRQLGFCICCGATSGSSQKLLPACCSQRWVLGCSRKDTGPGKSKARFLAHALKPFEPSYVPRCCFLPGSKANTAVSTNIPFPSPPLSKGSETQT